MTKTYKITGMKCQGCVNTVTEKLSAVKGVDKVQVSIFCCYKNCLTQGVFRLGFQ